MPRPEIARPHTTTHAISQNQTQPDKLKDCFLGLIQDLKQEIHTTFTRQLMEIKDQLATVTATSESIHATNANESPTKQHTSNRLEHSISANIQGLYPAGNQSKIPYLEELARQEHFLCVSLVEPHLGSEIKDEETNTTTMKYL